MFNLVTLTELFLLCCNRPSLTPHEEAIAVSCIQQARGIMSAFVGHDPYKYLYNADPAELCVSKESQQNCLDFICVGFIGVPLFRKITEERVGMKSETFNALSVKYDLNDLSKFAQTMLDKFRPLSIG